ncbi:hypothetical protein CL633_00630 [bacterium]|nr:hypothetical protein [bacterium]|tara:strand:- start:37316 stop:38581 length:1266 start_codon:yes stop_codon:yes gene_type:complete
MKIQKTQFKNGLRVILVPMQGTKTASVHIMVGAGSKYETKKNNGISHFLEHMFFKGTKKRPNTLAIAETLDRVGGSYNAFTSEEHTGYYAKVNSKNLDLALDWVWDIFLNSTLPEIEIEREKGVITEEINMYQDTPMSYIRFLFSKLLYKDQPAGWMISGSKENIASFKKKDFIDYMDKHYKAENTVVCIAGNIDKNLKSKLENQEYFKNIKTGNAQDKKKVDEQQNKPDILIHKKQTDQTHFCLGVRGYDLSHPDKYALAMLGTLLGGMMSSRLWIAVRERHGLAYYVHTQTEHQTDTGCLVTQAGVDNNKADQAIKIILAEYAKLRTEKVKDQEFKKVKENIKGKMALELESSDSVASWVAAQEILKKEILTPDQVFRKIDAVSASDIQRIAKDVFQNKKLNLAVIGPNSIKINQNLSF